MVLCASDLGPHLCVTAGLSSGHADAHPCGEAGTPGVAVGAALLLIAREKPQASVTVVN